MQIFIVHVYCSNRLNATFWPTLWSCIYPILTVQCAPNHGEKAGALCLFQLVSCQLICQISSPSCTRLPQAVSWLVQCVAIRQCDEYARVLFQQEISRSRSSFLNLKMRRPLFVYVKETPESLPQLILQRVVQLIPECRKNWMDLVRLEVSNSHL